MLFSPLILIQVHLKERIEHLPSNMYMDLSDAGTVFSTGQKQLLGLARAMLKQSKIVIFHEATSGIDPR